MSDAPGRGRAGCADARGVRGDTVVVVDAGVGNLGNVMRAVEHLGRTATVTRDPRSVATARTLLLPGVGAFAAARAGLRGDLEASLREAVGAGAWLLGICVGFQLLFAASEEHGHGDGLGLLDGTVRQLPASVPRPHIGWNRVRAPGAATSAITASAVGARAGAASASSATAETTSTGATNAEATAAHLVTVDAARVGATGAATRTDTASTDAATADAARVSGGNADRAAPHPLLTGLDDDGDGTWMYFLHSFAPLDVPAGQMLATTEHGVRFASVAGRGRVLGTQFHPERSGRDGLRLLRNFLELADGSLPLARPASR